MDRNSSYFYISGFISLSLFSLFLSLFAYMMFNSTQIENFAIKKDDFISISLNSVTHAVKKSEVKEVETEKIIKEKEIVSEVEIPTEEEVDVSDLFSDVWTKDIKKIKPKPKKENIRNLHKIQKKIETLKTINASNKEKRVNTDALNSKDENLKVSSGKDIDEYLAKINALVYKHFNPPPNSEGNSVKARIDLSAIGKVEDFRILNYSTSESLNRECDRIKTRLMSVVFPINPENKSSITVVILTSKE